MKKLLVMLTMIMTMAFASVCAAYDGGVLNKEQKAAEMLTNAVTGQTVEYAQVTSGMNDELKTKITEQVVADLQKQVKEQFGNVKEVRFQSFERFADGDRLVYIAGFSKEEHVALIYIFDAKQKMVNFQYTALKEQTKEEAKK